LALARFTLLYLEWIAEIDTVTMILLSERIATLKLSAPLCVPSGTSVREVIERVQRERAGCILICTKGRPIGIMTERDVLMKVVARDVNSDEAVDKFMTPDPRTLTPDKTVGEAISMMYQEDFRHVPIIDAKSGEATAIFNIQDAISFLCESFPEHVINLPPRPHQTMKTPEGG